MGMIVNPFGFGPPGDPLWTSVAFLSGYEGVDAATSFTDESNSPATITPYAAAQIDTAQFKFGASSLLLDGNTDGLSLGEPAKLNLGSQKFTLETFVRFSQTPGFSFNTVGTFFARTGGVGALSYLCRLFPPNLQWYTSTDLNTFNADLSAAWAPSINTWYHVAIDRGATKQRMFIDGVMVASISTVRTLANPVGTTHQIGGVNNFFDGTISGWLDETRYTVGSASRYDSDSSFTVPALAFPRS